MLSKILGAKNINELRSKHKKKLRALGRNQPTNLFETNNSSMFVYKQSLVITVFLFVSRRYFVSFYLSFVYCKQVLLICVNCVNYPCFLLLFSSSVRAIFAEFDFIPLCFQCGLQQARARVQNLVLDIFTLFCLSNVSLHDLVNYYLFLIAHLVYSFFFLKNILHTKQPSQINERANIVQEFMKSRLVIFSLVSSDVHITKSSVERERNKLGK